MKSIGILLFFLILAPLVVSFNFFKKNYADQAQEMRNKVGKNLAKKHRMDFFGTSGGMMNCVRMVGFSFEVSRPVSRDEARFLLVDCVEDRIVC